MTARVPLEVRRQRLAALSEAMQEIVRRRREGRPAPSRRGRHQMTPEEQAAAAFREDVAALIGQALLLTTDDEGEAAKAEALSTGRSAIEVFLSDLRASMTER